jgi:cell fate (sporulation/competence/biofilm development) regulator YlbF (YheA/YmcA/DUF963 family)
MSIYEVAYSLEKAIRQSEEFQRLKKMYEEIHHDETTSRMFNNFRTIQMRLYQKQMTGEEILPEEVEQAQKMAALAQQHDKIAQLMELEQRMNFLIGELNKIVLKPLEELYNKFE